MSDISSASRQTAHHFFFSLLIGVIVLSIFMFLPFLTPVVLAAVLAVLFTPLHRRVVRYFFRGRERSSIAAFISSVIIALVIIAPVTLIASAIYSEVQNMYAFLTDESGHSQAVIALASLSDHISAAFSGLSTTTSFDATSFDVTGLMKSGLEWVFANVDKIFSGLSHFAFGAFIMILSLFYFLRDGRELKRQLIALSPLVDTDDSMIFRKLEQTIYSVFAGSIAVGIIQGILTGIGFSLFHVPSPALWGSVAAVAALIPGIGTSMVLLPGIAYLFLTGNTNDGIGLAIWGVLAVGLIDNLLGPILVNRGVKIHPFLILLSVFGGLAFFGPIGFVLGPIIMSFLFALLEIYRISFTKAGRGI